MIEYEIPEDKRRYVELARMIMDSTAKGHFDRWVEKLTGGCGGCPAQMEEKEAVLFVAKRAYSDLIQCVADVVDPLIGGLVDEDDPFLRRAVLAEVSIAVERYWSAKTTKPRTEKLKKGVTGGRRPGVFLESVERRLKKLEEVVDSLPATGVTLRGVFWGHDENGNPGMMQADVMVNAQDCIESLRRIIKANVGIEGRASKEEILLPEIKRIFEKYGLPHRSGDIKPIVDALPTEDCRKN